MERLSKEALLAACARSHEDVSVRGKGTLRLREMSADEAIVYEEKCKNGSTADRMRHLLVASIVDPETDQPIFSAPEELAGFSMHVLVRLHEKAVALNGGTVESVKGE